jgi:hypothetical protein
VLVLLGCWLPERWPTDLLSIPTFIRHNAAFTECVRSDGHGYGGIVRSGFLFGKIGVMCPDFRVETSGLYAVMNAVVPLPICIL